MKKNIITHVSEETLTQTEIKPDILMINVIKFKIQTASKVTLYIAYCIKIYILVLKYFTFLTVIIIFFLFFLEKSINYSKQQDLE